MRHFLQVNRFRDVLWFNKEAFAQLLWWLVVLVVLDLGNEPLLRDVAAQNQFMEQYLIIRDLEKAAQESEYQVEKLLAAVKG